MVTAHNSFSAFYLLPPGLSEEALQQAVASPSLQAAIAGRSCLGELRAAEDVRFGRVRLADVSHIVTAASVMHDAEGRPGIYVLAEALDTPMGRVLADALADGRRTPIIRPAGLLGGDHPAIATFHVTGFRLP